MKKYKKESARARMRMLIKKLLKKHKYPLEGMEDAVQVVMTQCELWTDNVMTEDTSFDIHKKMTYNLQESQSLMVAEES